MSLSLPCRSSLRSQSGSAFVELVVSLPLLMLILIGTIDFARVFNMSIELTNAARAGAQFGTKTVLSSTNGAGMSSAALTATDLTGVTVITGRTCGCAPDDGTGQPWPAATGAGVPPCTVCATGHLVISVTVTTVKAFSMIAPFPGIPNSISITRAATLRAVN
jgi:Flp pilus assembly protein TadG